MKNKSLLFMLIALLSVGLFLAACSSGDDSEPNDDAGSDDEEATSGDPVEGGDIVAAMYSAPDHQFNPIFNTSSYDSNILDLTHESLIKQDENLGFIPSLAKDWEFNEDNSELTYFLNEGVKWHDGEEFTADDVVFTFTALADPGYVAAGGIRTNFVDTLVGYDDYVNEKTDEFTGVEKIDDYTVKFIFEVPNVKALADTSFNIIPEHVFADVNMADMPSHSASIDGGEVIGTGPFQLSQYQEGEQYVLTRHDDYWQGKPNLDSVTWRVIDEAVMAGMLENEEIHLLNRPGGVPAADVPSIEQMSHITMIEAQDLGYQYMAFKFNHGPNNSLTDPTTWIPNEKVQDAELRQAILYALKRQDYVTGLLHGSGEVLTAPFPSASWANNTEAIGEFDYSPDKAEEILDAAGYEDVDGDGFRENPDGEKFTLNLDYPTGNEVREKVAPIIKENLEAVGISVNLNSPRDASAHFELIEENDTDIDLYLAGWSLASTDPDPSAIFYSTAGLNYPRYTDERFDALLDEAVDPELAFDQDYRKDKYTEWGQYFTEVLPIIPLFSDNINYAYNNKLQGITFKSHQILDDAHKWTWSE
ncbi:ABC transporter substrate-binding protein [Jeotgalibacillus marinus]|uniref:ABC transporter substrate-binding protein n=1 Tax=Jeotgalibacillus marinus TaxID=86667 RepID=A0ABV3Q6V1_9BACL